VGVTPGRGRALSRKGPPAEPDLGEDDFSGKKGCWGSRHAGSHPCSRRFSSSADAAQACRLQSGRQSHPRVPAPARRFCWPGAISPEDVAASMRPTPARGGWTRPSTTAARSSMTSKNKLPIRLLAVGGEQSIPNMGDSLRPNCKCRVPVVIANSGHFAPEEQPEALAKALKAFL
jgi:pimeloyl-ACP methyl ester carboxylesterase